VLPLADSTTTAFGILLAVVLVAGYVIIWALWHFVFRHAPPDDRRLVDQPPGIDDPPADGPERQ
jgi:hypothetical protein